MKLDEMKVQYERNRDGFTKESDFSVQEEKKGIKTDISGIAVKVSLCAAVLILAFVVRAIGIGRSDEKIAAANSNTEPNNASRSEQNEFTEIGGLKYVESGASAKWIAPVMSNDIELLRDGQLLRFTAVGETVNACMTGKVLSVAEDGVYGKTIRVQSDTDCETVYYGFDTILVSEGSEIRAGDRIGTVQIGRSIYLKVLLKGEPQDPTEFVDLSLGKE